MGKNSESKLWYFEFMEFQRFFFLKKKFSTSAPLFFCPKKLNSAQNNNNSSSKCTCILKTFLAKKISSDILVSNKDNFHRNIEVKRNVEF